MFRVTEGAPKTESYDVTLPHDAMIRTPRLNFYAGASTGFWKPKDIFYTKEFEMDPADEGKSCYLEFEGVFQLAYVYVNDSLAGRCMYGYGNYFIDLTKYLRYDRKNQIRVVIKNGNMSSRWYSGGGIYRDVRMFLGGQVHIVPEGARISTVSVSSDHALAEVVTPVRYTGCGQPVSLCVQNKDHLRKRDT